MASKLPGNVSPSQGKVPNEELGDIMAEIANGKHDEKLGALWKKMEDTAGVKDKGQHGQYLLAAHISWDPKNKPSITSLKYYKNKTVSDQYDAPFLQKVNAIKTKMEPASTLNQLASKAATKNTCVHTELQFIYGDHFRKNFDEGGVFLIYSKYIPCAGLAGSSFGECAGDMASFLVDMRQGKTENPVYFVVMYSYPFHRQKGQTNTCTSKLYLTLAGIPILKCDEDKTKWQCSTDRAVGNEIIDGKYINEPVFQRFPRIHQEVQKTMTDTDVFINSLAMGNFLSLIGEDSDEDANIYQRDAKNAHHISSWLGEPNTDINNVIARIKKNIGRDVAIDVIRRCKHYVNRCLPSLIREDDASRTSLEDLFQKKLSI